MYYYPQFTDGETDTEVKKLLPKAERGKGKGQD